MNSFYSLETCLLQSLLITNAETYDAVFLYITSTQYANAMHR